MEIPPLSISNLAVVGAGQLGTRHLQSLAGRLACDETWVVDPSPDAHTLMRQRLTEVGAAGAANIHFSSGVSALPQRLDVVVIATNSKPRLAVLQALLEARTVRFVILEKFLFPRLEEYATAAATLATSGVAAFVNCPRRLYQGYKQIRQAIEGPVSIRVEGSNWGLASNSVHWLDLLDFLRPIGSLRVEATLSEATVSKRAGYVEFFGRIEAITNGGDRLSIACDCGGVAQTRLEIRDGSGRVWEISESLRSARSRDQVGEFPVPFQSQLTAGVVDQLLSHGTCELTPFDRSTRLHQSLLAEFVRAYRESSDGAEADLCPVT